MIYWEIISDWGHTKKGSVRIFMSFKKFFRVNVAVFIYWLLLDEDFTLSLKKQWQILEWTLKFMKTVHIVLPVCQGSVAMLKQVVLKLIGLCLSPFPLLLVFKQVKNSQFILILSRLFVDRSCNFRRWDGAGPTFLSSKTEVNRNVWQVNTSISR